MVVRNSIVNKSIITIFMVFLTYSPVERRDYLKSNLSIEDAFREEAENIEELGNLFKSLEELDESSSQYMLKKTNESSRPVKSTVLPGGRTLSSAMTDSSFNFVDSESISSPRALNRKSVKVNKSKDFK